MSSSVNNNLSINTDVGYEQCASLCKCAQCFSKHKDLSIKIFYQNKRINICSQECLTKYIEFRTALTKIREGKLKKEKVDES